jgi:hypothetical protein
MLKVTPMRRRIEILVCLLLIPVLAQGADAVDSEIRFSAAETGPAWVGDKVALYLELWSNGLSFGDQLFQVPEVPGGFLLQADASTLNLTENRRGESWQGLRYTFLFYPQRAGRAVVPSFEVSFTARAGFGSEPVRFTLQTPPLTIVAQLPEGGRADALTVTTGSFSLDSSWSREIPDDGLLNLQTGDALTLEVRRRAADLPAMVFEPLPVPSIDGLGVYPEAPEVNDRVNRGELTGERTDRITFMSEKAGRYRIPDWRFQWWDPEQETLAEERVAGPTLEVTLNPAYGSVATTPDSPSGGGIPWRGLLVVLAGLALAFLIWVRLAPLAARWAHKIRARMLRRRRRGELQPLNPRS